MEFVWVEYQIDFAYVISKLFIEYFHEELDEV